MVVSSTLRQRRRGNSPCLTEIEEDEHGGKTSTIVPLLLQQIDDAAQGKDNNESSSHDGVVRMELLTQRPPWLRLDVTPFLIIYVIMIYIDNNRSNHLNLLDSSSSHSYNNNRPRSITVLLSATLLLQLAVVLAAQWNLAIRARVGYHRQRSNNSNSKTVSASSSSSKMATRGIGMTHVLIYADDTAGIVPIVVTRLPAPDHRSISVTCEFQHRVYRWSNHPTATTTSASSSSVFDATDADVTLWMNPKPSSSSSSLSISSSSSLSLSLSAVGRFRPLFYPTHLSGEFYTHFWLGHNVDSATTARHIYGPNTTVLQLPPFSQLLLEQLLAPFFLFQLLCVLLWSLDEYWYYALYTLMALLVFESTVAYNRLQSLQRLHRAGHQGLDKALVWRRGTQGGAGGGGYAADTSSSSSSIGWNWMAVSTRELVPGDVVSLQSGVTVPADIVFLHGTAVCDEALLTGESIPQLKHALDISCGGDNGSSVRLDLQDAQHKESVLFGGTVLLAVTHNDDESTSNSESNSKNKKDQQRQHPPPQPQFTAARSSPPDNGVVGMVLRTGFETSQGSLLRTLAHSSSSSQKADGVHNWDTFVFILLLVICAVAAAGYVLLQGWYDERRNRFRLLLHVVIIVTSVVPPELPMELSLAVTNSVADLMRRGKIYCTEHFRIPLAGQVDVCCFDKTGTLTSDEMRLKGVRLVVTGSDSSSSLDGRDEDDALVLPVNEASFPWPTLRIMAACHSLAVAAIPRQRSHAPRSIIGDPLEAAVLKHTGFDLVGNNIVAPSDASYSSNKGSKKMTILHRFAFSSKLKRMTALVAEEGNAMFALCKGAPETIKDLATHGVPGDYDDITFHHMSRGRRVLAMAYRELGTVRDLVKYKDGGRSTVERDLIFAGFLVLDCPLKPDSKAVISELRKSNHKVAMITGDALLTAAEVARQVGIIMKTAGGRKVYQIQPKPGSDKKDYGPDVLAGFECIPLFSKTTDAKPLELAGSQLGRLLAMNRDGEASFCMTGDVLPKISTAALRTQSVPQSALDEKHLLLHPAAQPILASVVPLVSVFARHAPHQKEAVIAAFNRGGFRTCMCGDGTNDVGALKRASVGISIISAPEVESKQRNATAKLQRAKQDKKTQKKKGKGSAAVTFEESLRELREAQEQLDHVELGDASVAAPFTSRQVSIKCCKDVIQQGRCTLVSMLSIYKILGINCLVNAMVLSKLFLHGAKQGDRQLTLLGIAIAAMFYFVTRAEPLPTLSPIRPPSSVLCTEALLSITSQFVVHCVTILVATEAALGFVDPYDPSLIPDGPFNPNVLNTCTFLLMCLATVNTFAVNYRGRPFMADLKSNKLLYRALQFCYVVLAASALEVFPPLNDLLQLTPLPSAVSVDHHSTTNNAWLLKLVLQVEFPIFLCCLMVLDTVTVFALERFLVARFEGRESSG